VRLIISMSRADGRGTPYPSAANDSAATFFNKRCRYYVGDACEGYGDDYCFVAATLVEEKHIGKAYAGDYRDEDCSVVGYRATGHEHDKRCSNTDDDCLAHLVIFVDAHDARAQTQTQTQTERDGSDDFEEFTYCLVLVWGRGFVVAIIVFDAGHALALL